MRMVYNTTDYVSSLYIPCFIVYCSSGKTIIVRTNPIASQPNIAGNSIRRYTAWRAWGFAEQMMNCQERRRGQLATTLAAR